MSERCLICQRTPEAIGEQMCARCAKAFAANTKFHGAGVVEIIRWAANRARKIEADRWRKRTAR